VVSAHPKTRWQVNKTPEQIAFVEEASIAYFTRDDLTEAERQLLKDAIRYVLQVGHVTSVPASVDDWLKIVRSNRP